MSRLVFIYMVVVAGLVPGRVWAQAVTQDSGSTPGLPPGAVAAAADSALPDWLTNGATLPRMAAAAFAGEPARVRSHRYPVIAGTLGFIVPGAGHFYASEPGRGVTVLAGTMVGAFFALSDGTPNLIAVVGSVAYVGGWTFSVVDGSLAAHRYNLRHEQ